jgi:predicted metalloendopeptidase
MKNKKKNTTRRLRPSDPMLPQPVGAIRPGKNFYKHVNGHWLQHASIPHFRTSFGVSEEVRLLIERQLETILSKCYKLAEKGRRRPQNARK